MCQQSGWSDGVLQGVLDVVLHDGLEAREEVALLLVCVEGLGDLGGEASELMKVGWLGNSSP
jgi:hypothetical protein